MKRLKNGTSYLLMFAILAIMVTMTLNANTENTVTQNDEVKVVLNANTDMVEAESISIIDGTAANMVQRNQVNISYEDNVMNTEAAIATLRVNQNSDSNLNLNMTDNNAVSAEVNNTDKLSETNYLYCNWAGGLENANANQAYTYLMNDDSRQRLNNSAKNWTNAWDINAANHNMVNRIC
ncbi:hypothetical protein K9M59_03120 [Candidatus Gracilibacteria bacterium]|nr:hypothetical protein [Candidatus Gracilibacteria bacterium]MCF7819322.1 hypothetical protein [Candidatus Gracilibacteria bacterium]